MKFYNHPVKSIFAALCASLFICSARVQATLLDLKSTIHDAQRKNIAFFSVFGGSSHYTWVLSIGEELGQRGHNFYFLSANADVRYGEPFPNIKTVPVGAGLRNLDLDTAAMEEPGYDIFKNMKPLFKAMSVNFSKDFAFAKQFFTANQIDLVICDHMAEECIEAAIALNIPFVVSSTADYTKETSAPYINNDPLTMKVPTTENESISTRFHNKFVMPAKAMYYLLPEMKGLIANKKKLGINAKLEHPYKKWEHSLKLVNNLFGFTAPRPTSSMVEMVGPIIPKRYKPLTQDLQDYLDVHHMIAYVAFGQATVTSVRTANLILTAVVESIERGVLDGFIWATVNAKIDTFPTEITTSSGKVYRIQDIFNQMYPQMRMEKWTPQTALLLHPSTAVFVSHGGLGSWYESMYAGTRMIVYPYFADQPLNANTVESSGLGAIMRPYFTPEQAADMVCNVTNSKEIGKNIQRYQALVHIHSDHGIIRGANLMEEVLYTNKNGRLFHRESADKRMSFVKSHNIDIWFVFTLAMSFFISMFVFVSVMVCNIARTSLTKQTKAKIN